MGIEDIIKDFRPVSLAELDAVQLQNRIDTKYILSKSILPSFLLAIKDAQYILEIDHNRAFTYETTYFDTASYQFYRDHHNGCINRIKVRCRAYKESGLSVYEIKRKLYGTRTDKLRYFIPNMIDDVSPDLYQLIEYKRLNNQPLEKKLINLFKRITLTNQDFSERITIDYDIQFTKDQQVLVMDQIAIIEVKQFKANIMSHTIQALKKFRIYPNNFSKYAIGVSLLESSVKNNFFKPTINIINKIQATQCPPI